MPKFMDLSGKRFGRLVAIKRLPKDNRAYQWLCKCDCGNEVKVYHTNLTRGHSTSCGCYMREIRGKGRISHHMSSERIYNIWRHIKDRCTNPKHNRHANYYDKGITVCDKWLTFEGFYEDMSDGYADNLSIDRKENDKGYYKENCRWSTATEQTNNQTRNHFIEVDGKCDTIANTCRNHKVNYNMVRDRILNGWSSEDAVKIPKGISRKLEAV